MRALTSLTSCSTVGCSRPTVSRPVLSVEYDARCTCGACPGERNLAPRPAVVQLPPRCGPCASLLDAGALLRTQEVLELVGLRVVEDLAEARQAPPRAGVIPIHVTLKRATARLTFEPSGETS